MLESEQFKPPIEISHTATHPSKVFLTPRDLLDWVSAQKEWIETLRAKLRDTPIPDGTVTAAINSLHLAVHNRVYAIQQQIDMKSDQGTLENLFGDYIRDLEFHRLVHSESRVGRYISKLLESDALKAIRILAMYCNVRLNLSNIEQPALWLKAASTADLLEKGYAEAMPDLDPIMERFSSGWDERFILKERDQAQVTEAASVALAAFNLRVSEGNELIEEYKRLSQKTILDGRAELEAVRDTYKTELTLQAPTTYWSDKSDDHRVAAVRWAIGFGAAAVAGSYFIWSIWRLTAGVTIEKYQAAEILGKTLQPPSYGTFIPVIGAAFLVVWVLRILSRQLLANLSLGAEASERVAMVKTFLALMQKPDHVKADDRILILSALFRSSPTSGEDATPPNWFDMLMQRIKA